MFGRLWLCTDGVERWLAVRSAGLVVVAGAGARRADPEAREQAAATQDRDERTKAGAGTQ